MTLGLKREAGTHFYPHCEGEAATSQVNLPLR
jgi:hypothetical protein